MIMDPTLGASTYYPVPVARYTPGSRYVLTYLLDLHKRSSALVMRCTLERWRSTIQPCRKASEHALQHHPHSGPRHPVHGTVNRFDFPTFFSPSILPCIFTQARKGRLLLCCIESEQQSLQPSSSALAFDRLSRRTNSPPNR